MILIFETAHRLMRGINCFRLWKSWGRRTYILKEKIRLVWQNYTKHKGA